MTTIPHFCDAIVSTCTAAHIGSPFSAAARGVLMTYMAAFFARIHT
jgi:hypothetical protein